MNYQSRLRQLCIVLLQFFLFAFSLLLIARGILFSHIQDVLIQPGVGEDIWRAFRVGARFDAKVTAIAYAPLLLAGLILAASGRGYALWQKVAPGYHCVIALLYVLGGIGNYYYYLTYGSHVDLFMFGLWEDDSQAVLINIWQDYPVLRALLLATGVCGLAYGSARRFMRSSFAKLQTRHHWHWSVTSLVVLGVVVVTFVVARGSLSSHPLKRYHAAVSPYKPLNMITPNVFMALDWAVKDYQEQCNFAPVSQAALQAQMKKILGQPTPEYHTPRNDYLQQNPPHVVVAMMESMGMNILIEDDAQHNDLLGSFRQYRDQGFWFERFMAGTSATIDSIVMTLFHSPVANISHSEVQNIALPSSAALPYKRAGYEVVFLYGGNGMWRNLANYLPVQGFDRVYDENDIMEAFPESEQYAGPWGVPDGYLFKFANQVLEQAEKPTMMFIMTVTNHSPYQVPEYYQPGPTKMSERLSGLIGYQGEQASVLLQTFQYASDALGQFIGRIKQSEQLKDNTVIAVTGDHRMRYSSTDEPEEFAMTYAVPFYLNVPDNILASTQYEYDPQRVGSHRDLFPTLYHFSLSDQRYISLGGENMLAEQDNSRFGYNATRSISQFGAFSTQGNGLFYPWKEASTLRNQSMPVNEVPFDTEWAKEYHLLQDYYLRSQVLPVVQ